MNNENVMKNFAVIGVGGYIAPRHLKAIKETNNNLVAAVDPKDSVGILDGYFTNVEFFKEFETFDKYAERLKREDKGKEIDYVSICSPNYLHDSHIFSALRLGANVICEKPLVLRSDDLDYLSRLEKELGTGKINTVLQLRLHPILTALKERVEKESRNKKYDIDLTYITPRGKWYYVSWKGDIEKSGGVSMNIGVHFFDMLCWIFGGVKDYKVFLSEPTKMSGYLELEKANVRWYLSLNRNELPQDQQKTNSAFRSITIDGEELEFSEGFGNLHTEVYKRTLTGQGFGINDAAPSIRLVEQINKSKLSDKDLDLMHPMLSGNFIFVSKAPKPVETNTANVSKSQNIFLGKDVVLGQNIIIGNNVSIHDGTKIGDNVVIHDNAVIGKSPMVAANSAITQQQDNLPATIIGNGCVIGTGAVIYRGASLDTGVFVADLAQVRENVSIGEKTIIGKNATIENKVTIGKYVKIQANVQLVPYSIIEDYVFISPGVMTSNDAYVGRTEKRFSEFKGVTVKKGARLGVGSIILPGVTIYEDALIGGGAVVTKDVPARKIAVGCPAYILKDVPQEQLLENQVARGETKTSEVMSVPFIDLKKQYKNLESEINTAVNEVMSSGIYIMGGKVKDFEAHISDYLGQESLGCASGSDALLLALMAAGIKQGDEVITSPFTFFATAGAVARLGAKPVFVDVDPYDFTIDPTLIERVITENTKAIIPVHIFGNPSNMREIMYIAKKYGLVVIEDACQSIGSEYFGQKLGTIGDYGCYSFFPTKNLGGIGDGGLITAKDPEKLKLLRKLRVHGAEVKYFHDKIGINSRLDPIQAAVLDVKLKYLDEWNQKRIEISKIYTEELAKYVQIVKTKPGYKNVYHQYPLVTDKRDNLLKFLKDRNIESSVYYPLPLHLQKCFEELGYKENDLPVAEKLSKSVLSIPIFPEMTGEQIAYVISSIECFLSS